MRNDNFADWIQNELNQRGWNQADLAKQAKIAQSHLSRILSGMREPGPTFCNSIARALHLPPEIVFRKAGLLPPEPERTSEEKEAVHLLRELSTERRQYILTTMRALAKDTPPPTSKTSQ